MKLTPFIQYCQLALLVIITACDKNTSVQNDPHYENAMWNDTIRIAHKSLKLASVVWNTPQIQSSVEGEQIFGEWTLYPEHKAISSTITPGRVKRIRYQLNDIVKAGTVLVELESREWMDLQGRYFDAVTKGSFLLQEYDRLNMLKDQDAISLKAWQQIVSEKAAWQAAMATLEADIRLHGVEPTALNPTQPKTVYTLSAPISGRITHSYISPGQWLESGATACNIADLSQISVTLNAYPRQIAQFQQGDTLWLSTEGFKEKIPARIQHIDQIMAQGSQTITIHALPLKRTHLPPVGSYVSAYRTTQLKAQQIALPESALRMENGRDFILLYLPDASSNEEAVFLKKMVHVIQRSEGNIVVTRPPELSDSTLIVTEGAYYIHAQSKTADKEHDH